MEWLCSLMGFGLLFVFAARAYGSKAKESRQRKSSRSGKRKPGRVRSGVQGSDDTSDLQFDLEVSLGGIRGQHTTSVQCWVPPGREAKVGPYRLPGGMVYVGENLPDLHGWGSVEPALIDPSLDRTDNHPDHQGQGMPYWPSYSNIPAASRSGYLAWLANGRSNPAANVGYVFLFLYGLERRAESLPEAVAEIPTIADEVERLLAIYGGNGSFRGYAARFLQVLRAGTLTASDMARPPKPGPTYGRELPFLLRAAVARMAVEGRPLPADWALSWVRLDPEIRLRTPARRCPEEFDTLFKRTYGARYGEGVRLKVCKRTLCLEYRPASASFGRMILVPTDLPDVTSLVGPRRKLTQLASECDDELAAFSRWMGRYPEGREQLAATALLPGALLADHAPAEFRRLKASLEEKLHGHDLVTVPVEAALDSWLPPSGEKLTKKDSVEAARLLARAGLGIEPDARFGGRRLARGDKVVLFRQEAEDHETPTPAYSAASVLLHLAALVSSADGEVSREEKEKLSRHLAAGLHLDASERRRLTAHLKILLEQPPGFAGVKKRIESLSPTQREGAGRFLIQVAWADGVIEPEEVKSLTRIFRLLGLDPGSVHQWLHEFQAGADDSGPIQVQPMSPPTGYAIPEPPASEPKPVSAALDIEAIQAKLDETAAVSAMLSGIFDEEDEESAPEQGADVTHEESGIAGLDAVHSSLLRRLGEKTVWEWEEYVDVAESLGLMASGALDSLNEVAFDVCDRPLTEGEDPIAIDVEVYREVVT